MRIQPTYNEVNDLLAYDPKTGVFKWKEKVRSDIYPGDIAGTKHSLGYIEIGIKRKQYKAHRLAWLLYYKEWPKKDIDHEDRIRHHNWIKNLRKASRKFNLRNSKQRSDNTSGVRGISLDKKSGKWFAYLYNNSKQIALGKFDDFDDAVLARYKGEKKYNFHKSNKMTPAKKYCIENELIILVKIKRRFQCS